jgi:hypothetical protein
MSAQLEQFLFLYPDYALFNFGQEMSSAGLAWSKMPPGYTE